jgi:hypothetical protein
VPPDENVKMRPRLSIAAVAVITMIATLIGGSSAYAEAASAEQAPRRASCKQTKFTPSWIPIACQCILASRPVRRTTTPYAQFCSVASTNNTGRPRI